MQATGNAAEAEVARDLAARVRAGDRGAEADFVGRYSRGLLFFLRRQCGNEALADDIHQETFRVVLLRLREGSLEDSGRLVGFLQRTARNLLIGEYRKTARRKTDADDEAVHRQTVPAPQLDRVLLHEEVAIVRRLISELKSSRDREILYRFYVAEEGKERICGALELSSRHFDRVLFRARERFGILLKSAEKQQKLHRAS